MIFRLNVLKPPNNFVAEGSDKNLYLLADKVKGAKGKYNENTYK